MGSYPPGIPAIAPGELFDEAVIEYLEAMEKGGAELFGEPRIIIEGELGI